MNSIARRQICGLGLLASLAGCGADSPGQVLLVRDSANIQIVEVQWNSVPVHLQADPDPDWIVGSGIGRIELSDVRDVLVIDDRTVVIADGGAQQILRVDLVSGAVERWGRPGDGPLEYRGIQRVFGDGEGGLVVHDGARRRLIQLDGLGNHVEELSLPGIGNPGDMVIVVAVNSPDSRDPFFLAAVPTLPPRESQQRYRGEGFVVRRTSPGDTLATIRGPETFMAGVAGPVVFGASTVLAGSKDGLWIGDTAFPEVRLCCGLGQVSRIVRWTSAESRQVTAERTAEYWRRFEEAVPPEERGAVAHLRELTVVADSVPAFGSVVAGPRGQLWIGSYIPPEYDVLRAPTGLQEWLVFDFESMTAGRTAIPLRVFQVGEDYVVGVHRDELGVETVRRHSLRRLPDSTEIK